MAAIYCAYRALANLSPGRKSVQFGFPYVDALKIQEKFGSGVHTFLRGDAAELDEVAKLVGGEPIMGLLCEFPGNPLLRSPDLGRLDELSRRHEFPLVVDDTLSAHINTNLSPSCDMLATSLTKFFSGAGDVMGGSLVLNPSRPLYDRLKTAILAEYEDLLFAEDAIVLERNSRDVVERVRRINQTTEQICDTLRSHPLVERVDYPKYNDAEIYRSFLREEAGYGGLFSLQLRNAAESAPRFYDALRICKGPNLGTNFSLCCPYTILAHYHELDFAERCGVSRNLLRISIGLEDAD
jgi:cystathionine gamma-synthase